MSIENICTRTRAFRPSCPDMPSFPYMITSQCNLRGSGALHGLSAHRKDMVSRLRTAVPRRAFIYEKRAPCRTIARDKTDMYPILSVCPRNWITWVLFRSTRPQRPTKNETVGVHTPASFFRNPLARSRRHWSSCGVSISLSKHLKVAPLAKRMGSARLRLPTGARRAGSS